MRVGRFAAQFFQPGGARQHHVREPARGLVEKQIVADQEIGPLQAPGHPIRIGEGGEHVGAEHHQHLDPPIQEGFGDAGHLAGEIGSRWPPFRSGDGGRALPVTGTAVTRSETSPGSAQIAGQARQAGDGAGGPPAIVTLVHGTSAQHDHGGFGYRVPAGQFHDPHFLDACPPGRPGGREFPHVRRQLVEPDGVSGHEIPVVQFLGNNHVHHGQRQVRVRPGTEDVHVVGLRRRFRVADVHGDHPGAAALGGEEVPGRVGLAGQVGPPQNDQAGVRAHVLLGVGFQHTGQPGAEGPQAPADHGGVPPLAAVIVGETGRKLAVDARAVIVGEQSMAGPESHRFPARRLHSGGDEGDGFLPTCLPPRVRAPFLADQRTQQPVGIADHLPGGLPPHAQKPLAIWIVRIPTHLQQLPIAHLGQHSAQGGVATHGTHGAHGARWQGGWGGGSHKGSLAHSEIGGKSAGGSGE